MSGSASLGNSSPKWIAVGLLGGLPTTALAVFIIFSSVCPCERTPGGYLFGETVDTPVIDWNFANEVQLCQLQIYAGIRPHSINLNCMSTPEGELFLSCPFCNTKYWAARVENDEPAVLRLNDKLYPVKLNRVQEPATMDQSWLARVTKLRSFGTDPYTNNDPSSDQFTERADHWWTFRVESRS